jgi:acyl-CoA thioesterase I
VTILALGDSITAGFGLPQGEGLPEKLEERLTADGYDVKVINGGVSGDTTAGGRARLDWALGDRPSYALVELGANDALRGLDPKEAEANLDAILARLAADHVKALLIGMLAPGNWGHTYQQQFDAIYPDLAKKYHVPLYPFILDGVALDPKLNQGDGLHPNEAGVKVIVDKLAPMVETMLKSGAAG